MAEYTHRKSRWRRNLYQVIFEADTRSGKAFDILLLVAIVASVTVVMLDSIASFRDAYGAQLRVLEWTFTILFMVEYVVRLVCVDKPLRYALSFFGVVDLLAVLPSFAGVVSAEMSSLLVVRVFRLLRVFRVLKLIHFLNEGERLLAGLKASLRKITVFIGAVLTVAFLAGSVMYMVEGEANGFSSIPTGVYWAIVTMTTVGYGDIAPVTAAGKLCSVMLMIFGYGIIAVPTGIISVELSQQREAEPPSRRCEACGASVKASPDANYCSRCGAPLR